ncbi:hypothetical protein B0H13DRAFT_2337898 [Mycena leptocephala]|nr:hypothetical protein B0H13DRAFT_2337898 [Mycena leptocephala]
MDTNAVVNDEWICHWINMVELREFLCYILLEFLIRVPFHSFSAPPVTSPRNPVPDPGPDTDLWTNSGSGDAGNSPVVIYKLGEPSSAPATLVQAIQRARALDDKTSREIEASMTNGNLTNFRNEVSYRRCRCCTEHRTEVGAFPPLPMFVLLTCSCLLVSRKKCEVRAFPSLPMFVLLTFYVLAFPPSPMFVLLTFSPLLVSSLCEVRAFPPLPMFVLLTCSRLLVSRDSCLVHAFPPSLMFVLLTFSRLLVSRTECMLCPPSLPSASHVLTSYPSPDCKTFHALH